MDRNQQSFLLWEEGKKEEAINLLLEEIEESPSEADAYIHLGTMFMTLQKFEEAQGVFTVALEKNPKDPEIIYCLGSLYYEEQKYEEAIKTYEEAIQLEKDSEAIADADYMIALCYQNIEQFDRALVYGLRAVEMNPAIPEFYALTGDILLSISSFEEAKTYYDQTIERDDQHQEAYFKRGLVAFVLEDPDSENYFKKAQQLDHEASQQQLERLQAIEQFMQNK